MKRWILAGVAWGFAGSLWAADVPAVLQWSQRVELSPRVSGLVASVAVNVGDRVKAGQALLTLDNRLYQAKVAEGAAAKRRLSSEAAQAKIDLGRVQELYDRTVISTSELDQAKLRNNRTQAQLREAEARLAQDSKDLADATLRAPFAGVVVERRVEPGQNVVVGLQPLPLLALAKSGEMLARMKLTEGQIQKLKNGQAVTVSVGNRTYPGQIKTLALEPSGSGKEGPSYQADAVFSSADTLRAGSAALV
ncbi:MAG: efflux RND transporter periplasmic adaptor subunit, partial [Sulfuricellaceae bacterium]|nr:efflux RND transporter periplasmic adaptor subunit [Sulfuricellaceae bacterium]